MPPKRRLFTGNAPIGGRAVKSRRVARQVTSAYHDIRSSLEEARRVPKPDGNLIGELESKLEAIGGIDGYQQSSIISTKHFRTSRWVLQQLSKHHPHAPHSSAKGGKKLEVLEVGAINTQLQAASHLIVRAIDVNSQDPRIEELDFFDLPPTRVFDAVVCSMVINCVTDCTARGEMLVRLCLGHLRDGDSCLLLALPGRCVASPAVGTDNFAALLEALGMECLESRQTPKIAFYTLKPRVCSSGTDYASRCAALMKALPKAERTALMQRFRKPVDKDKDSNKDDQPLTKAVGAVGGVSGHFRLYLADEYWG